MNWILLAFISAAVFQGALIVIDEFYFHQHRILPRWERWGHPLDTFFLVLALSVPAYLPISDGHILGFSILAVISCLFVIKDESVHLKHCSAGEQFMHALLFMIHPIVFILSYEMWIISLQNWIQGLVLIVSFFMFYQLIYWNLYENSLGRTRPKKS